MRQFIIICFLSFICMCCQVPFTEVKKQISSGQDALFVESFLRQHSGKSVYNNIPVIIFEQLAFKDGFVLFPLNENKLREDKLGYILPYGNESSYCLSLVKEAKQKNKSLAEAVNDFCRKNTGTKTFDSIGPLDIKYVILTKEESRQKFKTKGVNSWEDFKKIYPGAEDCIFLTLPGLSEDGTFAVIYMWKKHLAKVYVMEKINGRWINSKISIGNDIHL